MKGGCYKGSALLILLLFMLFGASSYAEAARRRFLRIRYLGNFDYVRIYINDDYRGKVFRDQSRSFLLRAGRRYFIAVRYGSRVQRRTVYLSRGRSRTIVFRRPTRDTGHDVDRDNNGGRRFRYLIIRYKGEKPYVRISINGRRRGRIYRDASRRFLLRGNRWYMVRLRYGFRKRTKRVRLPRYRNRRITFYFP